MGNVGLRGTGSWKCGFRRAKNGQFGAQNKEWGIWGSGEQEMRSLGFGRAKNGQFWV